MLILSLAAATRGPVRIAEEVPADDPLWGDLVFPLKEPVRVDLEATPVGEGILVRGDIEAVLEGGCRRCLAPVPVTVRDSIDLLYEPLTDEEAADLGGEVYPLPSRGDDLDLGPAVREQLVLRIPAYVVCGEACRGLCPQCGVDLNRGTCDCVPAGEEGPWAALKKIKFD
jgi:uncharacterized protein